MYPFHSATGGSVNVGPATVASRQAFFYCEGFSISDSVSAEMKLVQVDARPRVFQSAGVSYKDNDLII